MEEIQSVLWEYGVDRWPLRVAWNFTTKFRRWEFDEKFNWRQSWINFSNNAGVFHEIFSYHLMFWTKILNNNKSGKPKKPEVIHCYRLSILYGIVHAENGTNIFLFSSCAAARRARLSGSGSDGGDVDIFLPIYFFTTCLFSLPGIKLLLHASGKMFEFDMRDLRQRFLPAMMKLQNLFCFSTHAEIFDFCCDVFFVFAFFPLPLNKLNEL